MSETIEIAGRTLIPIMTGYAPHAYVFAIGETIYRLEPRRRYRGYVLGCTTAEGEATCRTLHEAVAHANRWARTGVPPAPKSTAIDRAIGSLRALLSERRPAQR